MGPSLIHETIEKVESIRERMLVVVGSTKELCKQEPSNEIWSKWLSTIEGVTIERVDIFGKNMEVESKVYWVIECVRKN